MTSPDLKETRNMNTTTISQQIQQKTTQLHVLNSEEDVARFAASVDKRRTLESEIRSLEEVRAKAEARDARDHDTALHAELAEVRAKLDAGDDSTAKLRGAVVDAAKALLPLLRQANAARATQGALRQRERELRAATEGRDIGEVAARPESSFVRITQVALGQLRIDAHARATNDEMAIIAELFRG